MRTFLLILCLVMIPLIARAGDMVMVPEPVQARLASPLHKLGEDTYRTFGFRIYRISMWVDGNAWNPEKPHALELRYLRSISKDTMLETIIGNIRDEGVADDETIARWEKLLNNTLPEIESGDVLTGLELPGKETLLFHNGAQIAEIKDRAFSVAFFNIWLGKNADENMRGKLLGGDLP